MPRRLTDLKALGVAWAEKTLAEDELAAWRKIQDANARRMLKRMDERERPYQERPICACGKASFPTKKDAMEVAKNEYAALRPYLCPLGTVYHLQASGPSTRQGGFRP